MVAVACAMGVCGCTVPGDLIRQAQQEARERSTATIRDGLTKELDGIKQLTPEAISDAMGGASQESLASFEAYGVDVYDLLSHLLAKFDYSIEDILVDGSTATARVRITNVDVAKAVNDAMAAVESDELRDQLGQSYGAGDDAGLVGQTLDVLYERIDATEETITSEVSLSLSRNDQYEWTLAPESLQAVVNAAFGLGNGQ